jgi:SAM-dependent methyltransferase
VKFHLYANALRGRSGLEIGGPSEAFSSTGQLPIYTLLNSLDGCNFSSHTAWEGRINAGEGKYVWSSRRPTGRQYVLEASCLNGIGDRSYDCVLSCHCIEHLANPLAALKEWRRVLREDGYLVLVVPHRNGTFDRARPVTSFEHLLEDHMHDRGEDDLTHLEEALALHDYSLDVGARNRENFQRVCLANKENRRLHHHVFNTELVLRILDHANFRVVDVSAALPCHIIALAQKTEMPDNGDFFSLNADWRRVSPFYDDRAIPDKDTTVR